MISPITLEMGASTGAVTPVGSCDDSVCSFSATICRARKMSVPQSNSTHTTEIPCAVDERTRRTPVAPFTAVSIGNETSASTSSGAIPCASVSTVTVGAVRSGKTSTGMRYAAQAPSTSISAAAASTNTRFSSDQAMSRFSMRRLLVLVTVRGHGGGERRELHVVRRAGDDALAGAHALEHEHVVALASAEPQLAFLERLALGLHVGDRPAVLVEHRGGGDHDA